MILESKISFRWEREPKGDMPLESERFYKFALRAVAVKAIRDGLIEDLPHGKLKWNIPGGDARYVGEWKVEETLVSQDDPAVSVQSC